MGGNVDGHDAFEIFEELFAEEEQSASPRQKGRGTLPAPLGEEEFYEIEYDSSPFPGAGKFVLKSSKIEAPPKDAVRERFDRMRDIARENRQFYFNSSKFYDRRVQQENSRIFFRQGVFMEDFEDDYEKSQSYSAYFPSYQTMGYEQLRTYFTWRTQVRLGNIEGTSLSYAFLYIYELINLIGVAEPKEGLERLLLFWDAFRVFDRTLDRYVPGWMKDYHIYYDLPGSFREFVKENNLGEYYPDLPEHEDRFDLLCSISKYDIRKSPFFAGGNEELVRNCFGSLMGKLEGVFAESGMSLDEFIFQPTKKMPEWIPFKGALLYPDLAQDDRRVVISEREIYICFQGRWTYNTTLTTESGKKLMGYVMKQMEAVLRKAVKYKHKLSANMDMVSPAVMEELERAGIDLGKTVEEGVLEFHREATKTVVRIDAGALERIRREALQTQEKLVVPEQEGPGGGSFMSSGGSVGESSDAGRALTGGNADLVGRVHIGGNADPAEEKQVSADLAGKMQTEEESGSGGITLTGAAVDSAREMYSVERKGSEGGAQLTATDSAGQTYAVRENRSLGQEDDPWKRFGNVLSEAELKALTFLLYKDGDKPPFDIKRSTSGGDGRYALWQEILSYKSVKQLADGQGIMLEVLMDGINEKAMDYVGDSLLDDDFIIYDDYIEQTEEMVEGVWQGRYLQG